MNRNLLRLLTVAGLLFCIGNSAATTWGKDIKRIVIPFSLTAGQLPDPRSTGAELFASYCGQCHDLPSTKMHSAAEWPLRFEKMMDHATLMAASSPGIKTPADKEKEEIVSYLGRNGFRELPANAPLRSEPEAFNLLWYCSVCHAVPDPDQFPANEWSKIVDRMNGYRKKQGRDEMSNADRNAIIDFLGRKRQ